MIGWPRTFSARLALTLLALLLLVGAFSLALSTSMTYRALEEVRQGLNRDLARRLAAIQPLLVDGEINRQATENLFHTLMEINPAIEVYLLDSDGSILAVSAPPEVVLLERVDPEPIEAFLESVRPLPIRGDDPRHPDRQAVFSAARVSGGKGVDGYLYVILGGDMYQSALAMVRENTIVRQGAWLLAASLLVAAVAGVLLFRFLTRRLRQLAVEMGQSPMPGADSGPSEVMPSTGDEIDVLEQSFLALQTRVELQLQQLRRLDAHRRELIANVSHDLRTPLAALSGYLETLQVTGARLSNAKRQRYLDLAQQYCDRLGDLIGELFELARLDAGEELDLEPVSLGELIQDNAQKFELSARKLGVSLVADVVPGLPWVHADIHLMERLLENLIENALHHTPEGGEVRVAIAASGDGLRVTVSDTGPGIPEAELESVFDRFHRKPEQPGRGAGLGLAIARRIAALHGGALRAENRLSAGTRFVFDLPGTRPPSEQRHERPGTR